MCIIALQLPPRTPALYQTARPDRAAVVPPVSDAGAAAGAAVSVRRPAGPGLVRAALHALPRRRAAAAGALPLGDGRPPARRPALTLGGARSASVVAGGAGVAVCVCDSAVGGWTDATATGAAGCGRFGAAIEWTGLAF